MSESGTGHGGESAPPEEVAIASKDSVAQHATGSGDNTNKELSMSSSLGNQLPESIPRSSASGLAGDATVVIEEDLSKETPARTSLSLQRTMTGATDSFNIDRKEQYKGEAGPKPVKQKEFEQGDKILEIFGVSSCPSYSAGQKKSPETLATHRWKAAYQHVKKTNAMKRRSLSSPIGTGAKLDGNALCILNKESELRKTLFDLLYSEYPPRALADWLTDKICFLLLSLTI